MATDDLTGLIPEIYYDLIARVAAGVSVLVFIISPTWEHIENSANMTTFIALLGLGYVVGHLLTTVSIMLNGLIWNRYVLYFAKKIIPLNYNFEMNSARKIFDKIYTRIDWVARQDKSGGAILKKMEAGAALTDSLLSGWVVVLIYSGFTGQIGWGMGFDNTRNWLLITLVTALLLLSVPIRRALLIIRQDRILHILKYDPKSVEGVQ
jgi:hypothetical protein